jgi:hypothetical protein
VIAESPGLSLAHVRKTLLLVTMGNLDAALESARRARDADPLMPLTAAAEVNVRLWRRQGHHGDDVLAMSHLRRHVDDRQPAGHAFTSG